MGYPSSLGREYPIIISGGARLPSCGYKVMTANSINQRFTEALRIAAGPVWEEAVNHRLFREIGDDTVSEVVFKNYLVIEYSFVDTAARVLGYAIAKATGFDERRYLARGLYDLTTEQHDYFVSTFDSIGLPPECRRPSYPALGSAKGLHDLFLSVAAEEAYENILACMLGAEWLYLTWCTRASKTPPTPAYIRDWVILHTEEHFARHVEWMRRQLDALGPSLSDQQIKRLRYLFTSTLEREIAFHDAAYLS